MRRLWALPVLVLLALHAQAKAASGLSWELMWLCPVTAALLALGLVLDLPRLSAPAFLFQLAMAIPNFGVYLATGGKAHWTSLALHIAAPLAGWLAWRGRRLPASAPWTALGIYVAGVLASRILTPPALNVNLAFAPWEHSAALGLWVNRIANLMLCVGFLQLGHQLLERRKGLPGTVAAAGGARD